MINYLRSVLLPNYRELGLPDFQQIMISCPRLIAYELIVTEFAISLLDHIYQTQLCEKSTLEDDMQRYRNHHMPYQEKTILLYNIQTRQIVQEQIQILKVLKALLQRIEVLEIDDAEGFAACLLRKVAPYEDFMDEEQIYVRRMRLRQYFKDLRMSMLQIRDSKVARLPKEKKDKAMKKKASSGKKKNK